MPAGNALDKLIIVTGDLHSGKTSLLERFIGEFNRSGRRLAGILAPGSWKNGLRNGFDLVDIVTGTRVPLATRRSGPDDRDLIFDFSPEGLKAGREALSADRCRNAEVIVIDEIGKLELAGAGWTPYLNQLLDLKSPVHVWSVRNSLVPAVMARWNAKPKAVILCREPSALESLCAAVNSLRNESSQEKHND